MTIMTIKSDYQIKFLVKYLKINKSVMRSKDGSTLHIMNLGL